MNTESGDILPAGSLGLEHGNPIVVGRRHRSRWRSLGSQLPRGFGTRWNRHRTRR